MQSRNSRQSVPLIRRRHYRRMSRGKAMLRILVTLQSPRASSPLINISLFTGPSSILYHNAWIFTMSTSTPSCRSSICLLFVP